ncbi:hypothetical protein PV327_011631, partial [Microctonus hyperodae]
KYRRTLLDRASIENDSLSTSSSQYTEESHACHVPNNEENNTGLDDKLPQEKTKVCVSEQDAPNDEGKLHSKQEAKHENEGSTVNDEEMEITPESSAPPKKIENINAEDRQIVSMVHVFKQLKLKMTE